MLNDNSFDHFNNILLRSIQVLNRGEARVGTMGSGKVSKEIFLKYGIQDGEDRTEEGLYSVKGSHGGSEALVQTSPFWDVNGVHVRNELDLLNYDKVDLNVHVQNVQKYSVGVSSLCGTITKAT
ncbi:hypothetical protein LBBP_03672 [Leptospira borgpetersenii serovar Ballum]|nr:hypothetical protein LBBP_03672 [Leptospira borgpetersenii serovar Ballum]